MKGTSITFRVSQAEQVELARTAEREKINLSDYVRIRLGLRALGEDAVTAAEAATTDDRLDVSAVVMRGPLIDHFTLTP